MDGAGKVMGLASYGSPRYVADIRATYGRFGKLGYRSIFVPAFPDHLAPVPFLWMSARENALKTVSATEADIAASLQQVTTELLLDILEATRSLRRSRNLCLGGGLALNCVANEAVRLSRFCERVFVGPAPNDAGLSIGLAFFLWHNILGNARDAGKTHSPFHGPPHDRAELEAALMQARRDPALRITVGLSPAEQDVAVARRLVNQMIVGVHRGRSESGPRALGNRSILADPRNGAMKETINARVKFRESFRPFAPAVLAEHADDYFHFDGASPYMSFAPRARSRGASAMSATVHVDGSARLQTVDADHHPRFRQLIQEFYKLCSVPGVLNTSLNTRGEPLCETPLDSLNTLRGSGLDALLIEDALIEKARP
jgi:carbamoyltransferase